jgi:hypothetical protein
MLTLADAPASSRTRVSDGSKVQVAGRLGDGQFPGQDKVEDIEPLLCVIASLVSMGSRVTKSLAA